MPSRTARHALRVASFWLAAAMVAAPAAPALACMGNPDELKPASAGPATNPDPDGSASGLRLVAHLDIPHGSREANSDIWKLGDTVAVGYRCGGDGSALIDVADPEQPRIVYRTPEMRGTFANDVKAIHLAGPSFTGDLFIEPHDQCTGSTISAKTRFWDITDPSQPRLLSQLETVSGVHNAFPFLRDGRAYLLLALPLGDTANKGIRAGFAVADISDPVRPSIVGQYNLRSEQGDVPGTDFLHDVWASADGQIAFGAWWDAGLVVLDISDVYRPRLIQRLSYYQRPDWYGPAAGNTHAAVPLADGRHVVITDEDFSVGALEFQVTAPASVKRVYETSVDDFVRPVLGNSHTGSVDSSLVYVAEACSGRPSGLRDRVALLDRSPRCTPAEQVAAAQEADAAAVVLIRTDGGDAGRLEGWHAGLRIPAVQVSRSDGARLKSAAGGTVDVRVRLTAHADAWGFTRIADLTAAGGPRLVANITTANTDYFPPRDNGWYSAHNPMVVEDTLYLSHYSDGVRVWDVSNPEAPHETAFFVPPDLPDPTGRPLKTLVWGVFPDGDLIYASDVAHGLWILAADPVISIPTPPPTPSEDPTLAPTSTPTATATPAPTATPEPTEAPPPTWLPPPALPSPSATATASPTLEPTSTSAPRRPGASRLYLPFGMKPRRSG